MPDALGPPLSPFADLLGMAVAEVDADHVVLAMTAEASHANRAGFVHGGALVSLADTAATVLANYRPEDGTDEVPPFLVSIDLHAVMVGNQRGGSVRAEARVVRHGRRVTVIRTRVLGEDDRLMAEVTTTHVPS